MSTGLQRKGIVRKNKMLHEAIKLFLENGYEKTTTASIAKAAGMSPSSFFAAFESKEALLLTLVETMFESQFCKARQLVADEKDVVLLYGVETSVQMYITELSEPLREMYVAAYSLPSTSEYIMRKMAERLQHIFSDYLPQAQLKDFYEMEIASGGVTRAFMAKRCDMYFTMERKLTRYLQSCLTLYSVPEEKQRQIIPTVLSMNLQQAAQRIIETMLRTAETGIERHIEELKDEHSSNREMISFKHSQI